MKLKILLSLICLTFVSSCTHDNKKKIYIDDRQKTKISIKKIDNWKISKYSELFDSIKFVQLETTEKSIIGRIDKLINWDNKYFILDQVQRKAVLVFDDNGKYLNAVGRKGKGPGEYIEPNDININYFSNEIAIWCNTTKKIIFYDFKGNYKHELKLKYYLKSFAFFEKNKIALYLDIDFNKFKNKRNLIVINIKGKTLYEAFDEVNTPGPSRGGFNFLSKFTKNNASLLPGYSNKIYSIYSDKIKQEYEINFGNHTIPENFYSKPNIKFTTELRNSDYAYLNNHFDFPKLLIFNFIYKNKIYSCFYQKQQSRLSYNNIWINDLKGMLSGSAIMYPSSTKNELISVFETSNIGYIKKITNNTDYNDEIKKSFCDYFEKIITEKKLLDGLKNEIYSTKFIFTKQDLNFINSINSNDNPILIIKRIKK
ncbi:6-bladed beta-propeller [Flavivirga rizhaonensis]|uniref:6-bladed beta-propeller n=1 Tax=Flavivirga rizhaonensis TaxID=2559571 RepID=A0A4S1DUG0_9FLAO|nr:6-bladed beta-propeller [Flavivirga rizhaonensis]TGV01042.1 6-bladed beta-propeller [Flavivirga rizhaonensis]